MRMLRWITLAGLIIVAGTGAPGVAAGSETGPMKVAVVGYGGGNWSPMADPLVNAMETALIQSGRFEVYERARLKKVLDEVGVEDSGLVDPEQAVRVGKLAGVQYVIYGSVNSADCKVTTSNGRGGTTYSETATVSVHHAMTNVETGQIKPAGDFPETRSGPLFLSSYPTDAEQRALCLQAAQATCKEFVMGVVPPDPGRVIAVTDHGTVKVRLDMASGIGQDVDVAFYHLTPEFDREHNPLIDPDTGKQGVRRAPIMFAPRKGHEEMKCVGQLVPGTIEGKSCECILGYYGGGGPPFGTGPKFHQADAALDAIKAGDYVEIIARPASGGIHLPF